MRGKFRALRGKLGQHQNIYNLGRAREKQGDAERAVSAYRAYLKAAPRADDMLEVQGWIARLEGESVLRALATQVGSLEATGPSTRKLNNNLRSYASVPMRMTAG